MRDRDGRRYVRDFVDRKGLTLLLDLISSFDYDERCGGRYVRVGLTQAAGRQSTATRCAACSR